MGFENVGRLDISMYDTHFKEVLNSLNNFGYEADCLFLTKLTVPCEIL